MPLYETLDISGQKVLVTGASAGIGEAIAWRFAEAGCELILCARRAEKLQALRSKISDRFPGVRITCEVVDVRDTAKVAALPARVGPVDILVNNAGLALGVASVEANDIDQARQMVETNVLGPIAFVSAFAPSMLKQNRGHIVNISSVAGHESYQGGSVYASTKFAVNAFTIAARHDLAGTPVRVTAISPGLVETEFSVVRFAGDKGKADKVYEGIVPLNANDIADQVIYSCTRPRHVQVADIISYATNQGHAKYVVARQGPNLGAKL
eukprot:TRINITY_DN40174_c0_g1_i1.p1 TRINITY_DN40174_c0_g1~~TRINITY_DN40174_c0_g1_i1.p1  ORF type:complete len:289 (+),score=71.77 TRINITY_DN40174_c0_g1_i1:66-869(+)